MPAVYTTNPLFCIPSAQAGVSITPAGTDFGLSAWTVVSASTPEDWAVAAIAFEPGVTNVFVRLYVGVGSPGNEVITAIAEGWIGSTLNTFDYPRLVLDIPLPKEIPAGSRVSVAMVKSGTDTSAWTGIKLNYYKTPLLGNAPTTDATMTVLSGSNVGNATPFADSLWTVISASTPTEYLLAAITPVMFNGVYAFIELGIGTPGNEVPITCVKADSINTTSLASGGPYQCKVWPLRRIPAGSRLVGRVRKSGTSTSTFFYEMVVYEALAADYPDIVTSKAQTWLPNNSAALGLAVGSSWGDGAWTEFSAALPARAAITAIHPQMDTSGGGSDFEIDVGHGAALSEAVDTTHRTTGWGWTTGADRHASFKFGSKIIEAGERLLGRVRAQTIGVGYAASLGLIYDPDFEQVDQRQYTYPPAANRVSSAAGNATPWANSNWSTFHAGFSEDVWLTGLTFAGHGNVSHELEFGLGADPSSNILTTLAIHFGGNTGGTRDFPIHGYAVLIPANQIVSVRFRKAGVSTGAISLSMSYIGEFSDVDNEPDPDPFVDYWEVGQNNDPAAPEFPEARVLAVSPTRHTNYARGKLVEVISGTELENYPATNASDGDGAVVSRIEETHGGWQIDLEEARLPDVFAVVNHNIPEDVVCGVQGSNDEDFATVDFDGWGMFARRPVTWLDLRGILMVPCRYWRFWVLTADPADRSLGLGEFVIGTAVEFDGLATQGQHTEREKAFVSRAETEEGLPYKMHSGAIQRALIMDATLFEELVETMEDLSDDAGESGERVLVIPNSRQNEAYYLDWPAAVAMRFPESRLVGDMQLDLPEESFGVV